MNFTRRVALAFEFLLGRQVASVGAGDVPGGAPAILRTWGLLFEVARLSLAISSAFPRDYELLTHWQLVLVPSFVYSKVARYAPPEAGCYSVTAAPHTYRASRYYTRSRPLVPNRLALTCFF